MSALRLKCTKFDFPWGPAIDPAGGAYSALPDPLAYLRGLLLRKGRRKSEEGGRRERERKGEREERGKVREGVKGAEEKGGDTGRRGVGRRLRALLLRKVKGEKRIRWTRRSGICRTNVKPLATHLSY